MDLRRKQRKIAILSGHFDNGPERRDLVGDQRERRRGEFHKCPGPVLSSNHKAGREDIFEHTAATM
jgi:hypothetical protein